MRKPFDIKFKPQIESGEYKVETRDGQPVTILAFDVHFRGVSHMILAKYNECYDYWPINGLYNMLSYSYCNLDLFIVTPEPELTEFEAALEAFLMNVDSSTDTFHEETKKYASKLLDLARKEIMNGWNHGLRDTQDFSGKAYNDGYQLGFERGKAEALKYLPRWKQIKDSDTVSRVPHVSTNLVGEKMLYIGNNCISISKIMKLPDFKED